MKNNPLITLGVVAYNEEQNIEALLSAVCEQKVEKSKIKEILVYSDGSTDKTNEIVAKMSKDHSLIKLVKFKNRKGKYYRVNELFKRNTSDVLVILDADIMLKGTNFIESLINTLLSDPNALMVSGNNVAIMPETFVGRIICTNFILWETIFANIPGQTSAANFSGAATAYRLSFTRSLRIPTALKDPHLFIYLCARVKDGFRYCSSAQLLYYPINTLSDYKKFMQRSIGKRDEELVKLFGEEEIKKAYTIPKKAKIIGMWLCFIKLPFYTTFALLLSFYSSKFIHFPEDSSPLWDITQSSKKLIPYGN
jgi:glycosyltransferase involved in cell wall biosynthesis